MRSAILAALVTLSGVGCSGSGDTAGTNACSEQMGRAIKLYGQFSNTETRMDGTDTIETWYWDAIGVGQDFVWNREGTYCYTDPFNYEPVYR